MADRRSRVRWNRNADINTFTTSLRVKSDNLKDAIGEVVMDTAEAGAEGMREAIRTDTQTSWVGDGQYANEGRQDDGFFLAGVKEDIEVYNTIIRGEFGWLDDSDWLDYFGYQEHGFQHVGINEWIPGVQAAFHGANRAKSVAQEGMNSLNLNRKVTKRLGSGFDPSNAGRRM